MHLPEIGHDAVLPLLWIETRGNYIPPFAVPLCAAPNGQLYVARVLLGGEMHVGTTSHSSREGARFQDRFGKAYTVFEYEVLTCASSLRFQLEAPHPLAPGVESVRTTPRLPARRDSVSTTRSLSPAPLPKKTLGPLKPFSGMNSLRGLPATIPNERQEKIQNSPPPYTSPLGGWVEVPKHSCPIPLNPREMAQFNHLAQSKCFTLIDDTITMQYSWAQTRAALSGFVEIMSSDDEWDGLDVRFINHTEAHPCIKTREEFECVFNSVKGWTGDKVMATEVAKVFEESLALIHETSNPRPVNLLIITDGIAADAQELLEAIICFCQKLNGECIPPHMFRIHILQMGNDRTAVKPLHDFRDRITQRDRDRRILSVVSFHRGRGVLNAEKITKLLLASTHVPVKEDPDIGERLPPEVIEAQYQGLERIRAMGNR